MVLLAAPGRDGCFIVASERFYYPHGLSRHFGIVRSYHAIRFRPQPDTLRESRVADRVSSCNNTTGLSAERLVSPDLLFPTGVRFALDAPMKWHYLYTFTQSNLLEIPIFYLFYHRSFSFRKTAVITTGSNLITHPVVIFGFISSGFSILHSVLWAEIFAVVSEGFLHQHYLRQKPLSRFILASLAANLVSWQFGPVLTYFIFWK